MKGIIIQGSSRSYGHTHAVVEQLQTHLAYEFVDLKQKSIHPYDYGHVHQEDDFLPLMKEIVRHDIIVLASPIYWYSMSGLMKNFLDRITDCLKIEKETGRKLRGKYMAVISCGSEEEETPGFFTPFELTADYLGMTYVSGAHTWVLEGQLSDHVQHRIREFAQILLTLREQLV